MKTVLLVFGLTLTMSSAVLAQAANTSVTSGIVAFNQQKWKEAVDHLSKGLAERAQLRPGALPKAYWHRGAARVALWTELSQEAARGNLAIERQEEFLALLPGAYDDFKQAKATDDGKWSEKADVELAKLKSTFEMVGLESLNSAYSLMTDAEKQAAYRFAVEAMNYSIAIDPTDYLPWDLRAQGKSALKDSTGALTDFTQAGRLVEAETHTRPDLLIAYIFYRKALLERYEGNNINAALATIDKGKNLLDKEWSKIVARKSEMKAERFADQERVYEGARDDLNKFELDILMNVPDKIQQALDKFRDAIAREPKNYVLHVAYAQLLEKVGRMDDAGGVYEKATSIDPSEHLAWFNLGAIYVNKAVALYKEANESSDDPAKVQAKENEGRELLRKALPNMQKANEIDRCNQEVLKALLQITITLNDSDGYSKYKGMRNECQGQ